MAYIDVFNGDADGLCALHQLRLHNPQQSQLITGVKRDIQLVKNVQANADDIVTVLDISFDKNRDAVVSVLESGAQVTYIDHHYAGDIPASDQLTTHIDTDAEICTGLIVNKLLEQAFAGWAVVAAFGDNLLNTARQAAAPLVLTTEELAQLQTLGTLLNYNGYGATPDDLFFEPAKLYELIKPHRDPFSFINEEAAFNTLNDGYESDYARARAIAAHEQSDATAIYLFPNDAFARRISGVYANELAQQHPDRAHALLSELDDGSYLVSVRAPVNNRTGADEVCRQFPSGGGRKAAAGINHLPAADVDKFSKAMMNQWGTA